MPPAELLAALEATDDVALQALYDDLRSSYALAMDNAGVGETQRDEVLVTVDDYVTNNWF